ncbi:putative disease resistance protein RGA3 isoform X1 [Euphorbia lathyris]|uniref:putative disease resistance protein RGA3 isoform X1 n=1 Tax=Euphorbia lathyris TaxID=212925 RepID=UPI003313B9F7
MATKLKKVNQSLKNIQSRSISLQLSSIQHNLEDMLSQNRLRTESVVGRKADVIKIVNLILSSCYEQVTVVSIVGLAGVGKTVLAKLVCQKVMALTRKPFDVKIWVCVSKNFSEHKILGEMLQSLNPSMGGLTNEDAILQQLKNELVSRKFLLVLDDVSNHKPRRRWDVLKTLLSRICTNKGNAVLVTTRSMEVASIMETSSQHSHQLNSLSNDECWLILKERAFGNVTTPVPLNLEAIGREIAKTCGGIPLVATFLGGVMGFNRDEETWLKIRHGGVLKERPVQDNLLMFIQIFHHLPSYLKSCFALCSNFLKAS